MNKNITLAFMAFLLLSSSLIPCDTSSRRWPKFAKYEHGHIALQGDHGDICFANIKLWPLPAKL